MKQNKGIEKKLDTAWSLLIKLRAGMKCEYCGKTRNLNSHHINSRANKSVRWDVVNGVCLCVGHHIGVSFSAHKTPLTFAKWITKHRGDNEIQLLEIKSNQISHLFPFEKELLLKELQKEIKSFET